MRINYLSDALDTRKIREDALRRMAQGSVSPYARRSDLSGLCSVPDPFASGVGYPAVRGYRYEGHPAAGTAGKGGFNLADFGKELLTGFVAGGLSSAAFYGAGKAVEAVKGSVRSAGRGSRETELFLPDEFYNKKLPNQVTPGTRYLPKYDEFGDIKQIKMYDDFGREIGWVDYTNHGYGNINSPDYHTVPHWHEKIYNALYRDGMRINHRTDIGTPLGDK